MEICDDEIERLVQEARSDIPKEPSVSPYDENLQDQNLSDEVSLIHRNEGDEEDEEVDGLIDQQRREALEEDDDQEEDDESGS